MEALSSTPQSLTAPASAQESRRATLDLDQMNPLSALIAKHESDPEIIDLTGPEPPLKRRRLAHVDDKSRIDDGQDSPAMEASAQGYFSSHTPSSSNVQEVFSLPFPSHRPRVEEPGPISVRAPPKESLTNTGSRLSLPSPPHDAPRCSAGLCDFFPWQRNHQQDTLNKTTTRMGYSDKPSNPTSELSSARPSILSLVKHKSAQDALSTLLVATLDRRQQLCSVSAKNAFKPPPRVTLTDNKREAWLRDLANAAIPLRRLSRTIPHGIRGKHLLEHCLAKRIPYWRAVWLIKCVGSNELRAFRRKGAGSQTFASGGEAKWVRDWTESVLQFMDTLAEQDKGKQKEWRDRVLYILQLVMYISHERLLDRDAFLDGITQRFAAMAPANGAGSFVWLSVIKQYWQSLQGDCQRGRQLAACLLNKLQYLSGNRNGDAKSPLEVQCENLVVSLLTCYPSFFVLPGVWRQGAALLSNIVPKSDKASHLLLDRLRSRNAVVDRNVQQDMIADDPERTSALVALLDKPTGPLDATALLNACRALVPDDRLFVKSLISWGTTSCRTGPRPLYLSVRLLRLLSKSGFSCQEPLMNALDSSPTWQSPEACRLYRLVAELIRSHHFSSSKYLHSLMIRGMSSISKERLEFLRYAPPQTMTAEIINLASDLCAEAKCSPLTDSRELAARESALDVMISKDHPASGGLNEKVQVQLSELKPSVKYALAYHLRREVAARRDEQAYPSPDEHRMDVDTWSPQTDLPAILTVLELLGDLPTTADIIGLIVPSSTHDALQLLIQCVRCHHTAFKAVGALEPLFTAVMKRYAALFSEGVRDRELTKSLLDLACTIPHAKRTVLILRDHLKLTAPETCTIPCSPASDQMIESLQSPDIRNLASLENVLQNGGVLDEAVCEELFKYLMSAIEDSDGDQESTANALKVVLRMSEQQGSSFSMLFDEWLDGLLRSQDLARSRAILPLLIAGGLCSVDSLAERWYKAAQDGKRDEGAGPMALNLLFALFSPPSASLFRSIDLYYKFGSAQELSLNKRPNILGSLCKSVMQCTILSDERTAALAREVMNQEFFGDLVIRVLCDPRINAFEGFLRQLCAKGVPILPLLQRAITASSGNADEKDLNIVALQAVKTTCSTVDHCNLVPLRLLAQLALRQAGCNSQVMHEASQALLGNDSRWINMPSAWPDLLAGLPEEFSGVLHHTALQEIIQTVCSSLKSNGLRQDASPELIGDSTRVDRLVEVLEATETHLSKMKLPEFLEIAHAALDEALLIVNDRFSEVNSEQNRDLGGNRTHNFELGVCALVRVVAIYVRAPMSPSIPQEKILSLCSTISRLSAEAPFLSLLSESSADTILDVVTHLSSMLTTDLRSKCLSALPQTSSIDWRLGFALGQADSPDDGVSSFLLQSNDGSQTPLEPGTPSPSQQIGAPKSRPFEVDPWEMLQDTTPAPGPNDTCLSLSLFGARKLII